MVFMQTTTLPGLQPGDAPESERPVDGGNRFARIIAWGYLVLLTYLLAVPKPLWMFGDGGDELDGAVERSVSGFGQHVTAYLILAWLLVSVFGAPSLRKRLRWAALAFLHGLVMEGIQAFVPLRTCDWWDAAANLVGVSCGTLLAWVTTISMTRLRARKTAPLAGPSRETTTVDVVIGRNTSGGDP